MNTDELSWGDQFSASASVLKNAQNSIIRHFPNFQFGPRQHQQKIGHQCINHKTTYPRLVIKHVQKRKTTMKNVYKKNKITPQSQNFKLNNLFLLNQNNY